MLYGWYLGTFLIHIRPNYIDTHMHTDGTEGITSAANAADYISF